MYRNIEEQSGFFLSLTGATYIYNLEVDFVFSASSKLCTMNACARVYR